MLRTMSLKRFILCIVSIVVLCKPCLAEINEIKVVTEVWPPFRIADESSEFKYTGIDVDILQEIANRLGFTFKIIRLPWARCLIFMESGQADLITGLAYTPERANYINYSKIPYYVVSPAFYAQKGKGHLINRYADLYNLTIGHSINSAYFEPFNSDTALKKYAVSTEIQLIKMLAHGRLDVIIGTDSNVKYDIARLGLKEKIEATRYIPSEKIQLFIGTSKKSAFSKRTDEINRAIEELLETGAVADIAKKYF